MIITNAAAEAGSACGAERRRASAVATGELTADGYLAFVADLDVGDDINDQACWPKANPSYPLDSDPALPRRPGSRRKGHALETSHRRAAKLLHRV